MKFRMVLSSLAAVCVMYLLYGAEQRRQPAATLNVSYPQTPQVTVQIGAQRPTIEMAFVLDTTGSMGGMIDTAKQKIWRIVNDVMRSNCRPIVKVGLVAYRDHGDVYVTKVLPITDDLDKVYDTLMHYRAEGGGDTPEDVRQAVADGVHKVGWSEPRTGLAQLMFLVGDAPPHDDYADEPSCQVSAGEAVHRGIVVNTIECGDDPDARRAWQSIAQRGQGQFFNITENGGAQAITTPYDEDLSKLGSTMGATYIAYGGGGGGGGMAGAVAFQTSEGRAKSSFESSVATAAPAPAAADRAVNKAINSNAYTDDFVQDVENGKTTVDKTSHDDLPVTLQHMTRVALNAEVSRRIAERKEIRTRILDLSKKRDAYLADQEKKRAGGQNSMDAAVGLAIKTEAAGKGIKL